MVPSEWETFLFALKHMQLPKSCSLRSVQAQLRRIYESNRISDAQWAEFEAVVHQLDPALPWCDEFAGKI